MSFLFFNLTSYIEDIFIVSMPFVFFFSQSEKEGVLVGRPKSSNTAFRILLLWKHETWRIRAVGKTFWLRF